ncbi:lipase family protein [Erythrobacter donghaensis]|uniref:lipase family protein n=1 Tax=Erythrobacter donghaensis TaxID=267135 RepID=UPI000A37FD6E|nr:hypothetical protein [Erythrobacter donghaensis]
MGWGTAFKVAFKVASVTAKAAYNTYRAVNYVEDKIADAAEATKDAAIWAKDKAVAGAIATKDAAVWAKDQAVAGAVAAKDAAVAGAVAAKDAAVAGAVAAKDAIRAKSISAREQQIKNAYGTAHENLSQEVAGCPTQECPFKKAECTRLAEAKDKAVLADHSYMNQGKDDDPKRKKRLEDHMASSGWSALNPNDPQDAVALKKFMGVENPKELLEPDGETFRARVYKRIKADGTDEFVVSFRGTQTGGDWLSNVQQGSGFETPHYNNAMKIAEKIRLADWRAQMQGQKPAAVSFTGHSLGGGMASAAAYVSGYGASTYNAAGLNMHTVTGRPASFAGPVNAYFNAADPLNALQDNRKPVLKGLTSAVGAIPKVGGILKIPLKLWIAKNEVTGTPVLPQAYGTRRPLPLPPSKEPPGVLEGHGVGLLLDGIEMQQKQLGCQ